jgi:gliding motility-associated-like protein/uncharacterized repeat protein (TIGR01451 family)
MSIMNKLRLLFSTITFASIAFFLQASSSMERKDNSFGSRTELKKVFVGRFADEKKATFAKSNKIGISKKIPLILDNKASNGTIALNSSWKPTTAVKRGISNLPPPTSDLSLRKRASQSVASLGSQITYTLVVVNDSKTTANGVQVTDPIPAGASFVSANPSADYNSSTGVWNIGTIASTTDSVKLEIVVTLTSDGVNFNKAEITATTDGDFDSTPGNDDPREDDIASACVSVPVVLGCRESITLTAPAGHADYQWFRNGSVIGGQSSNTLVVTEGGNYTFSTNLNPTGCSAGNCCPIIVEQRACIGDFVWYDTNRDGIQDAGETGVSGVTVILLDGSGNPLDTTITGSNGEYGFTNLIPGDYSIRFKDLPSGYVVSPNGAGSDPEKDSDADPITMTTQITSLVAGENDLSWDLGINSPAVIPASLGDYVWYDTNRDGIQDAGETGVENVRVILYDGSGNPVDTTTTNGVGFYEFTGLNPGDYSVGFSLLPATYVASPSNQGSDDTKDSDADVVTLRTTVTTLVGGENDPTWDLGINIPDPGRASIGDFVWYDTNRDGIQDSGETGVSGVTVILLDGSGNPLDTMLTGTNGEYLFSNLLPGDYSIRFENIPSGYQPSPSNQGSDDSKDSDADPITLTTPVTTLVGGENDLTWDLGINAIPASLGDYVWYDTNRDGIQDAGETGVENVRVILYDGSGNPVDTTTTNGVGFYQFTGLNPGDYSVGFSLLPATYVASPSNQGSDDTKDSDADVVTLRTTVTTLDPGENDPTWDLGINIPDPGRASIGDFVWYDTNRDGIQDAGETGVSGVTVILLDGSGNPLDTMLTGTNGEYLFSNLLPGDYSIRFENIPSGYQPSPSNQGSDDSKDSDADPITLTTPVTTLVGGENDLTWDLGINAIPASLGDYVWYDTNRDGIQDAGETGVENVRVILYDGSGNPVDTTTTNGVGFYQFTGLNPGDYSVGFSLLPATYVASPSNQGSDDTKDSDADVVTLRTTVTTLDPGENDPTWDLGINIPDPGRASIGDFVWYDTNRDGIQDSGETGVSGVTVILLDGSGNPLDTMLTGTNGEYLFSNLLPGDYSIRFENIPSGYQPSPSNQGSDDSKDSDADPITLTTPVTTLVGGENDLTWDLGINAIPASLGDYVWYDTNRDGIQDAGETGVENVRVILYDGSGNPVDTTTTNGVGFYQFTGLNPGDYSVGFSLLPATYVASPSNQGSDDTKDSDADVVTLRTTVTTLDPGENDPTWDLGINIPDPGRASIGDFVWYDTNRDGIQDSGETGVSGVTVILLDGSGNPLDTMLTGTNGEYLFSNLLPGDYSIRFENIPSGYQPSPSNQGSDDSKDSDADPITLTTPVTTLVGGENDLTWDLGINAIPASLGDYVWYDTDRDGIQDAGETGVENVRVILYDGSGNPVDTTTTNGVGFYQFTGLNPGDYSVGFSLLPATYVASPSNQGSDDTKDSDADVVTLRTTVTTLDPGENDPTWDLGINIPDPGRASIGDFVWNDTNRDGIQDAGETGVSGVTVILLDGSGNPLDTMLTGTNGEYLFSNLLPGDYSIRFENIPSGYQPSPSNQGSDDSKDSDADPITLTTPVTTLVGGENDLTWDLGINAIPASLGDYVWYDTDRDGIQDAGETGVENVRVILYDGSGNPVDTTTTNGVGFYQFTGLNPGDYSVGFSLLPATYVASPSNQGSDDTKDSDADVVTLRTTVTTLDPGENDPTWDLGINIPDPGRASIGDFVWYDTNRDGIQDAGETGVPGVTVILLDGSGNPLDTMLTGTNGEYLFSNLLPGDYSIRFENIPSGYQPSPSNQGSDDSKDSDADPITLTTPVTTLVGGENDLTWDLGINAIPASLGDYVWYDTDRDGIQDAGETGVENVRVILYDGSGNPVDTTTTNGVGFYQFTGLNPGDYSVGFSLLPATYVASPSNQGSDDTKDSDADVVTLRTTVTTLDPGENDPTWDLGINIPDPGRASIGDFVWYDTNRDGIQDSGETGVPGVTVILLDGSGNPLDTMLTGTNGEYLFSNLLPGDYSIRFENIPSGYQPSPSNQGSDDSKDSDADPITLTTPVTTLVGGENDLTWDLGINAIPASLGDYVWYDTDRDGIQDAGETGVENVRVILYDGSGNPVDTTTTNGVGFYQFTGLNPGDYSVGFSLLPATYVASPSNQGSDDTKDSDADVVTLRTTVTTLDPGENDPTWDLGINIPDPGRASIGDFVWYDTNRDGIQDSGETGVPGVTVILLDGSGNPLDTMLTGTNGEYLFSNLLPGDYSIRFENIPSGYQPSPSNQGSDDSKDSDADPITLTTPVTTLVGGENDLTWDLGINAIPASLGDYVWYDTDRDGIQDAGETGVENVRVILYDGSGNPVDTTTTNGVGFYQFTGLNPGDYSVGFSLLPATYVASPSNQGSDDTKDSDADVVTLRTTVTTLVGGENDPTWDLGINIPPASLGDFVWNDLDRDGIQDSGEPGVPNVMVILNDNMGNPIDTVFTNTNGGYLFDNLNPGNYSVTFSNIPPDFELTTPNTGSNDALDSDVDPITFTTPVTNLDPGENDLTLDCGIRLIPASLGNFVWYDIDRDGIQDAGELGVENVRVILYDGLGNPLDTTFTDVNGLYLFPRLTPGDYSVGFSNLPASYVASPSNQGSDDATDSDADVTTLRTIVTTLSPRENDLTWDLGINIPDPGRASIGDFVWNDTDRDGIQDAGETGVSGVTVILLDGSGNPLDTMLTGTNGEYLFSNLLPGDYAIRFENLPSGYQVSPSNQGSDDSKDSDADPITLTTPVTTLVGGENDLTWDLGINQIPASLGDYVWIDTDKDGIQDPSEVGVPNVTVELYSSTGTLIGTDVTDGNGLYLFTNLNPGTYYVQFVTSTLPTGYIVTGPDQGSNDSNDSDANLTGRTNNITLAPGENNITIDMGIYPPDPAKASLGNFVWYDNNRNGLQDPSEIGVPNVTVVLFDATGNPIDTTVTSSAGFYSFTDLTPGDYSVRFIVSTIPSGYQPTGQDQGNDALDSDGNSIGQTVVINLEAGENDLTWDFGITPILGSIGNFVWHDIDQDGTQDSGEPGIPDVKVILYGPGPDGIINTPDDVEITNTITNSNGGYLFPNLNPGDYIVKFDLTTLPSRYVGSPSDQGNDGTDSDGNNITGLTGVINLSPGENDMTVDFGAYQPVFDLALAKNLVTQGPYTVGQSVTYEIVVTNQGQVTAYNIEVTDNIPTGLLFNASNNSNWSLVGSNATTVIDGPLTPGSSQSVQLTFTIDPSFTGTSITNVAQITDADDDRDPRNGKPTDVDSDPGNNNPREDDQQPRTIDLTPLASLGDYVWLDTNGDGKQDSNESGIPNVTVTLFNSSNQPIRTTTTNSTGYYLFDKLIPGTYYVVFGSGPAGTTPTIQDAQSNGMDTMDSDADNNGRTPNVTLGPGENNTSIDAGFLPNCPVVISGVNDFALCKCDSANVSITLSGRFTSFDITGSGGFTNAQVVGNTLNFTAWINGGVSNFRVIFRSANGCETHEDFLIRGIAKPEADFVIVQPSCVGNNDTLIFTGTASRFADLTWGGLTNATIISSSAATATEPAGAMVVVRWNSFGTRLVTLNVNDGGCEDDHTESTYVKKSPIANAGPDVEICPGATATLSGSGAAMCMWNAHPTLSNPMSCNPVVTPTVNTTYVLTVMDQKGCSSTDSVRVIVTPPAANAGPDKAICLGDQTTLTASGGGTYLWSTGATTATITVRPSVTTTYTVTVTDSKNCVSTDNVQVVVNPLPTVDAGPDRNICFGDVVTLTATPSATGGSYSWCSGPSLTPIPGATGPTLVVSPGTTTVYKVIYTDANGCSGSDALTIFVNPRPTANAGPDKTICEGGSVTLTATGGTQFGWSTKETTPSITVSPVVTTTYTVTVSSNGCSDEDEVTVFVNPIPSVNAGPDRSVCAGSSVTLTATGATSYLWDTNATTSTITVSPSATTTYTVTGTSNGCSATDQVVVTVNPTPTANAGSDQTICIGSSATLTASGGVTYLWSNGSTVSSISVTPSVTTTYTVTVTDANGCTGIDQVIVTVGQPPVANAGPDKSVCLGSSTTLTATGGTSYLWSTGQTTATITVSPTTATTYTVTVSNGVCTATDQVTVTINPNPTADIIGDNVGLCEGSTICLKATGGVSYQWSNGSKLDSAVVMLMSGQVITVTVTDANGCTDTETANINIKPAPRVDLGPDRNICNGGSITLTATGGGNYLWNTNATTASITVSPTQPTVYSVTVTGPNGCKASDFVLVTQGAAFDVASLKVDPSCGSSNGSITLTPSLAGNYSYTWTPNVSTTSSASGLAAGTYTIVVSDGNCSRTISVVLNSSGAISASGSGQSATCNGSNGSYSLNISGGTAPYGLSWSGIASGTSTSTSANATINNLAAGTYSVTVTDGTGCSTVQSFTINRSNGNLSATAQAGTQPGCGTSDGTIQLNVSGFAAPYTVFNGSNQVASGLTSNSYLLTGLSSGTFTIQVVDANGCSSSTTATLQGAGTGNFQVDVNATKTSCCGTGGAISLTPQGVTGATYAWSPSVSTTSNATNLNSGMYTITVTVGGCTKVVTVNLEKDCSGCQDIVTADTIRKSPDGKVCLPIPLENINDYLVSINGTATTDFHGCDIDSLVHYCYAPANDIISAGSFKATWVIGSASNVQTVSNLTGLVDWMRTTDAAGNWTNSVALQGVIGGNEPKSRYGKLTIEKLDGSSVVVIDATRIGIARGTEVTVTGNGPHIIEIIKKATCCKDTVIVPVSGPICPDYLQDQNVVLNLGNDCNGSAKYCLNLTDAQVAGLTFTVDGKATTTTFCNEVNTISYGTTPIPAAGPYDLTSWIVNGSQKTGTFANNAGLVSLMNSLDPTGNWSFDSANSSIVGGNPSSTYGNLELRRSGTSTIVTLNRVVTARRQGHALTFAVGTHVVEVTDAQGCTDRMTVRVECNTVQPCTDFIALKTITLSAPVCSQGGADVCLNLTTFAALQAGNYSIFLNGATTATNYAGCNNGFSLRLPAGTNSMVFVNGSNNCRDTVAVKLNCITNQIINQDVFVTDVKTFGLDKSELQGTLIDVKTIKSSNQGVVTFTVDKAKAEVTLTAVRTGIETAVFVLYDDSGIADTAFVTVTVKDRQIIEPIAGDDNANTRKGADPITINVLSNDTIFGGLTSIQIVSQPAHGTVIVSPDNTFKYVSYSDYCDNTTPDAFTYSICTTGGCDTATVRVMVLCDGIVIYNGFSPNGDGFNDKLRIDGIEEFPGNNLQIFNRWGNQVFLKEGYRNDQGWDGTWEGIHIPDGTYFYVLKDGNGKSYSGYIQLQR